MKIFSFSGNFVGVSSPILIQTNEDCKFSVLHKLRALKNNNNNKGYFCARERNLMCYAGQSKGAQL